MKLRYIIHPPVMHKCNYKGKKGFVLCYVVNTIVFAIPIEYVKVQYTRYLRKLCPVAQRTCAKFC